MPRLTPAGKQKLASLRKNVPLLLEAVIQEQLVAARAKAAALAPSAREEERLLSRGLPQGVTRRGRKYKGDGSEIGGEQGVPTGGRFIKDDMLYVRTAILEQPIVKIRGTGRTSMWGTCSISKLNEQTGFSWKTKSRGLVGPTLPFNKNLIGALENGGLWVVEPRTDKLLNPQPGLYTERMVKTLQPIGMFRQAKATLVEGLKNSKGVVRDQIVRTYRQRRGGATYDIAGYVRGKPSP